ncbi:MAG: hypothetical protein FRX49_10507 [Trebouxia sp. A1-2]|nr:MAG: hypothetical protein FRX49_10507 [Trebouxia sp. A1-2]
MTLVAPCFAVAFCVWLGSGRTNMAGLQQMLTDLGSGELQGLGEVILASMDQVVEGPIKAAEALLSSQAGLAKLHAIILIGALTCAFASPRRTFYTQRTHVSSNACQDQNSRANTLQIAPGHLQNNPDPERGRSQEAGSLLNSPDAGGVGTMKGQGTGKFARTTGNQALIITACIGPHTAILHLQQRPCMGSGFCNPDAP